MIIKQGDTLGTRKLELEILKKYDLPPNKSYLVEQEWKRLIRGEQGEKNTAYFLDVYLKDAKNWMVIHDLRIEYNGQVAQIDHLIINRLLEIYILETKAYGDILEVSADGSFVASYPNGEKFGVESPIEQNRRHMHLLKQVIKELNLSPRRLGVPIPLEYKSFVLIDPKTRLLRSKGFDTECVMKADQFISFLEKETDEESRKLFGLSAAVKLGKVVSPKTIQNFAKSIASLHKKSSVNYKERFKVVDSDLVKERAQLGIQQHKERTKGYFCAQCKVTIQANVAKFCFNQKNRFNGRAYCRNCQNKY